VRKKYLPIVVFGSVILLGVLIFPQLKQKHSFSQFDLDLNCNLRDKPTAFTNVCKEYNDALFLKENCVDNIDASLDVRCQAYFCAQRVNEGHSCE